MTIRNSLISLTFLAIAANAARNCSDSHSSLRMHKRAPNYDKKASVQMFGWNWKSIAAECEQFLGPAGVGFVQVNPPQEHIRGDQWWVDYQVVSYQIQSKRGSRSDFAEMVGRCKNAGVKVSVDVIWNHMSGVDNGVGIAGTRKPRSTAPCHRNQSANQNNFQSLATITTLDCTVGTIFIIVVSPLMTWPPTQKKLNFMS
ncbi:Alpha-amylase [Rhizoctonia solani]|uniref:Alpha-amylase n=1 Tax=Rhizoctonia solani TaxID=456999 RepID=A0A8H7M4Y3_9AGAM|nr:Alpha-amylase [Rhizoctonia solani]